MVHYILSLPVNRDNLLDRPTRKFTVDISDILYLLSTVAHTGVEQDDIQNTKEEDEEDSVMADVMS